MSFVDFILITDIVLYYRCIFWLLLVMHVVCFLDKFLYLVCFVPMTELRLQINENGKKN
jgi:hypothetical protein